MMTRPRAASLALLALGCGTERLSQREQAVFGGEPAPNETSVIGVVNFAGGNCSGSVLAPRLVLTARHCVAGTGVAKQGVICGQTRFDPPDSAGAIFVVPQPKITEDPDDYRAVAAIRMPDQSDDLCGTDVVLLRLKEPLPDITPLEPRLDAPVEADELYSSVGYGVDASLDDKPSGERKRRDGFSVTCLGSACGDRDVRDNEWVGSGGPCSGDSGGPAIDADGRVVGVVSRGKAECAEPVFGDVASRSEWLRAEALDDAREHDEAPPAWACDSEETCAPPVKPDPEPEPEPAPEDLAESCAYAPIAPRGNVGILGGVFVLGLALLRRPKSR
jgi:hypothetical protein